MTLQAKKLFPNIPKNSNPFHHDLFRMGTRIGENVIVMYENHDDQRQSYIIIVNTETGERMAVDFGRYTQTGNQWPQNDLARPNFDPDSDPNFPSIGRVDPLDNPNLKS